MRIMPANSTGWFFHCLARETGKLGHLFSPRAQRGPWPWFPYALDNGAFSCWNPKENTFNDEKWSQIEQAWRELLFWAETNKQKPLWSIVPDVPGNRERTLIRWDEFANDVPFKRAMAVQDGMTVEDVKALVPFAEVICIGGSTDWKWSTVPMWAEAFEHVHVLRCNSPEKLEWLRGFKSVKSCDGTGWNRGNRKQTHGLELFCHRYKTKGSREWMANHVSRRRDAKQLTFA